MYTIVSLAFLAAFIHTSSYIFGILPAYTFLNPGCNTLIGTLRVRNGRGNEYGIKGRMKLNGILDDGSAKGGGKNLFKTQISTYTDETSELSQLNKSKSWSEIVRDEIAKNRVLMARASKLDSLGSNRYSEEELNAELDEESYNFRLSPEGRLKLEDRIEHLRRMAHSNPVKYKEKTPILWIVRSSHGNYCPLLEKDEPRIKSLVDRVRKHFSKSELEILLMKLNVKMPLCEVFLEGTMSDLVRIFHARGGTLQFYVCPRFWTRCELLEKDPRLEAKYGKATAPGLFPQWDEDGFVEEIFDCLDSRPDYALEFRSPNAWNVIPMLPKTDQQIMNMFFEKVHWPTRLKVQRAFERGIEDFRVLIEQEYNDLLSTDPFPSSPDPTNKNKLLETWFDKTEGFKL